MLKRDITYTNWDNEVITDTLWFNISKSDIAENLYLKDRYEALQEQLMGEPREITIEEVDMILDLVKTFMRIGYGERPDSTHFVKNDEVWTAFTQTAAYDAFLTQLFENPEQANEFLIGVLPKDLMEQAEAELKARQAAENTQDPRVIKDGRLQSISLDVEPGPGGGRVESVQEVPTAPPVLEGETKTMALKEFGAYSRDELLAMSNEDFDILVGTNPQRWSKAEMEVAYARKMSGK